MYALIEHLLNFPSGCTSYRLSRLLKKGISSVELDLKKLCELSIVNAREVDGKKLYFIDEVLRDPDALKAVEKKINEIACALGEKSDISIEGLLFLLRYIVDHTSLSE